MVCAYVGHIIVSNPSQRVVIDVWCYTADVGDSLLSDTHEYFDVVEWYTIIMCLREWGGRERETGGREGDSRPVVPLSPTLQDISKQASEAERQERMLSILKSVGPAGFILLEPECRLILESKRNQ